MNRRGFLTGLVVTAVAAPVMAKPVLIDMSWIRPVGASMSDAVAAYWTRKLQAAFITQCDWAFDGDADARAAG